MKHIRIVAWSSRGRPLCPSALSPWTSAHLILKPELTHGLTIVSLNYNLRIELLGFKVSGSSEHNLTCKFWKTKGTGKADSLHS